MTGAGETGVKGEVTVLELSRQERSLARRSAETRAVVPSVELSCEVEMDGCLREANDRGCRPLAIVLAALAGALREFPRLNGAYRDGRYELYSLVNLGIDLPTRDGSVLATLFDAAARSAAEIESELQDLGRRALAGELSAAELSGATFTVTPPWEQVVMLLTPLIQPTQAGALAIGTVREAVVVRNGSVGAGNRAAMTLACDARIVTPRVGAAFLGAVKTRLEDLGP